MELKGSDYYNSNNSKKSNKSKTNFSPSSFGLKAKDTHSIQLCSGQQVEAEPPDSSQSETSALLPPIRPDLVRSCVVQFFDNGEHVRQRYRFKVRLNLTDGTNPEFISGLTKRWSDFVRHIPSECKQEIIDMVSAERHNIRRQTGYFPYIGKFHLNQGTTNGKHNHQTEPHTLVIVWYDNVEREWMCIFKIYDFALELGINGDYLTQRQREHNVKLQGQWQNPKYDKRKRPLTFAQRRSLGI